MKSLPSVSVTATADGRAEAAAEADAAAASEGEAPVDGGAADAAADVGEALPPALHAAMKALSPASPAPARNPRRLTLVCAIRRSIDSRSRSRSPMPVPPPPGPPGRTEPQ